MYNIVHLFANTQRQTLHVFEYFGVAAVPSPIILLSTLPQRKIHESSYLFMIVAAMRWKDDSVFVTIKDDSHLHQTWRNSDRRKQKYNQIHDKGWLTHLIFISRSFLLPYSEINKSSHSYKRRRIASSQVRLISCKLASPYSKLYILLDGKT